MTTIKNAKLGLIAAGRAMLSMHNRAHEFEETLSVIPNKIEMTKAEFKKKLDSAMEDLARITGKKINDLMLVNTRGTLENLFNEHVTRPLQLEQYQKDMLHFIEIYNDLATNKLYKQKRKNKLEPNYQYFTHDWRKNKRR